MLANRQVKRIWGIVMIVAMLASLLPILPQPVSAGPQEDCEAKHFYLNPPPGFPKCSRAGRPFNQKLWDDLNLLAYGAVRYNNSTKGELSPEDVTLNQRVDGFKPGWLDPKTGKEYPNATVRSEDNMHPYFKAGTGEYRYLGWDREDGLFLNPYFRRDAPASIPENREFIYRPWSNPLTRGRPDVPQFTPMLRERYQGDPENIHERGFANQVNGMIQSNQVTIVHTYQNQDKRQLKSLFDYMYVSQDPTVWAPGEGILFHMRDGGVRYQNFQLIQPEKEPTNSEAAIVPLDKKDTSITKHTTIKPNGKDINAIVIDLAHMPSTLNLRFDMSGKLLDDMPGNRYYGDRYNEALYYTRKDIAEWELKLSVTKNGSTNLDNKTYSTTRNGEVVLQHMQQVGKINPAYNLNLSKANYKEGDSILLTLDTTARFADNKNPSRATKQFIIQFGASTPPPPPPTPAPSPEPLVCSANIPIHAFDIVPFAASDGTDMGKVKSRSVSINGQSVNDNQFFGGAYIFGEDMIGLHRVDIEWVGNKPDQACAAMNWVLVHDTKPRAEMKFYGGSYKENRKMVIDNNSLSSDVNDQVVLAAYPIVNYSWTWSALDGAKDSDRRIKVDTDMRKEFLYKKTGNYRVTLVATNALGRVSDPYVLDFSVLEDFAPAVIVHPYASEIGRGEELSLFYNAVSTDGDRITTQQSKVYYDQNHDETFTQLVDTITGPIANYTPSFNKLGKYRIVSTVDEEFGEETIPEFITAADKRSTTKQMDFWVENYIPYSDIYTDIPIIRAQVDLYLMLDKNLAQTKIDYVKANPVTINNQMRLTGMDPTFKFWDMHTYTYSQSASTSRNTGGSYPSSTTSYSSGGYSGTLSLNNVSNSPYTRDEGRNETRTETKTASDSRTQNGTLKCGETEASTIPSSVSYSDSQGFSGTLSQTSYNYSPSPCTNGTWSYSRSASYSGTVSRSITVWVPKYVSYNDYTGYYSGTIYMDVRQPYTNPYTRTTSDKYVAYFTDNTINELADFNKAKAQSDAKVILVGASTIQSQAAHVHYISSAGKTAEQVVQEIVDFIALNNPPTATQTVQINETFKMSVLENDVENDPIIKRQTMYVHNPDFYDNPQGLASFASNSYETGSWSNQTLRTSFAQPGEYTVYRRVQDEPDPAQPEYSYYSNESRTIIRAHRKPIARATLDWTYNTGCSCYRTTWVDQSYDLDHQFSDPDKGIIERKVRYRKNGGEWVYAIPDQLDFGSYNLEYLVRDMELAWSDPFTMNFTLANAPPIQMSALARTELPTFTMNSIPASEQLRIYNIWTRYPYSHSLQVALYQGSTQRTTPQNIAYYTGTKTGEDISWNDIVYSIPATTPDGVYSLRLTAIGQAGQQNYLEWPVTVLTPINLAPTVPSPLVVNQTQDITATTTKYPNTTTVQLFRGTSYQTAPLTLTGITSGNTKNWLLAYKTPNVPDGMYTARFISTTPAGKTETKDVSFQLTHNRPPTVAFDWTPQPTWEGDQVIFQNRTTDPDGDPLTYQWQVKGAKGTIVFTSTAVHPQYRFSVPNDYKVTLTAHDGKEFASVEHTVRVLPLTLEPNVQHTPEWLAIHQDKGHQTVAHPKDFYSGERFELSAIGSPTDTLRVIAWIDTTGMDNERIYVQTELTPQQPSGRYQGSLYDTIFSSLTGGLPKGQQHIHYRIDYANGVIKEKSIQIQIIGHAQVIVNVHRRH